MKMLNINSSVKNLDINTIKNMEQVLAVALKTLKQPLKQVVFNVYFVGEKRIRDLNRQHRNIDRKTDVLSFPNLDIKAGENIDFNKYRLDMDFSNNTLLIGDIFICNQVAISQAKRYGHSYTREVCFLFLHGILHCLGYDHIKEEERFVMEEMQDKILNQCKITRE